MRICTEELHAEVQGCSLQAYGGVKMTQGDEELPTYVRVKDRAGREFICRRDALKDPSELTEEELKNCVDSFDEPFTDREVFAIIKSEFRKD